MNRKVKKSIKNSFNYLIIIIVLSILAFFYKGVKSELEGRLSLFKVKEIEVKGNKILSRSDILSLCAVKNDDKLLKISIAEVVRRLERSPYIKKAVAVKSLPAKLRITVTERRPIAFIYGRGLNLIDAEGYLMPVRKSKRAWNLPFITGITEPLGRIGKRTTSKKALLGTEILQYVDLMDSALREAIAEVNLSGSKSINLRLIKGGAAVKIDPLEYRDNLFVLSEYLQRYMNWEKLAQIDYFDVRFSDQIIIKKKKS